MEDIPVVREWVDNQIAKYREQLGINKTVYVFYNLEDMPKDAQKDKTVRSYKKYAAVTCVADNTNKKPHLMIIDLEWHKSFKGLEDTIAHELLHIRFPRLSHGEIFWKKLGMVLMGKRYKRRKR